MFLMKLNVSYCNKLIALFTFLNIVMKMLTKIQFTVQINTQVFLKMCVFNRAISNVQWSVWCGFDFTRKTSHPPLNFNNNSVKQVHFQKHLRVYLDNNLAQCSRTRMVFSLSDWWNVSCGLPQGLILGPLLF